MTKTRDLSDFLIEGGADLPLGKPHIVPGLLYPSYVASGTSNKLLDGTTDHSGAFGTEQSDGRKYYYTNIAGSKPIKDPRIGGHFGSQRYKCTSVQLLEQETATHGQNVYSIDGREWARFVSATIYVGNDSYGNYISTTATSSTDEFIEIVCYANGLNYLTDAWTQQRHFTWAINGGSPTTNTEFVTAAASPLVGRYVGPFSVVNAFNGQTLGINTIRLNKVASHYLNIGAFELIVQDTSNRNNIQIPSQNVVSFGKKFPISATAVHYDPFTTMSYGGSGTTLSALQSLIDTDTSLGMDAWKAGTSNYHRPWNGGRVVKWVDSSGTIKTSVNMMPPNAQNITTTASNAVSDAHVIAGTNDDTINFNTSAINNEQSELAKSFYNREFGNGSANGNASWADVSTLSSADDVAYVMDDGLTSISAKDVRYNNYDETLHRNGTTTTFYLTFIGTGIARHASRSSGVRDNFAQNLPYSTHILSMKMYSNADLCRWYLDGAEILDNADSPYSSNQSFYHNIGEQFHIHQPKRPPIPEDACVLADYMLMADFVAQGAAGIEYISKGVRRNDSSRDLFYNSSDSSPTLNHNIVVPGGFYFGHGAASSATSTKVRLPTFGTNFVSVTYQSQARVNLYVDDVLQTSTRDNTNAAQGSPGYITTSKDLGVYNFGVNALSGADSAVGAFDVVTPIHTSSHYQPFETEFLHELVGGDRNMEQTNLVCSPDGKTWDEVTRDTSYLGNLVISGSRDGGNVTDTIFIFDWWRGNFEDNNGLIAVQKKHWTIAYDRVICLIEGIYEVYVQVYGNGIDTRLYVNKNDAANTNAVYSLGYIRADPADDTVSLTASTHFKRGDYVAVRIGGTGRGDNTWSNQIQIKKV